ncbi:unnamed protein product, partial [Prorocentrum cordatum]
ALGARQREGRGELELLRAFEKRRQAADLGRHLGHAFLFSSQLGPSQPRRAEDAPAELAAALRGSFGLDCCERLGMSDPDALRRRFEGCVSGAGRLLWSGVFGGARAARPRAAARRGPAALPTRLELCAGSGEWAVAQARAEVGVANWVAVEIMRDRVFDIFTQMVFHCVPNLCVVGGDASDLLTRRVESCSVADVFINFPEPPHVTGCEDAESSLHLLTGGFLREVHRVLVPDGRLVILSDNWRYCRTLAADLAGLRGERSAARLFRSLQGGDQLGEFEDVEGVALHHGVPGPEHGHAAQVPSRFDSRWQGDARTERFFLALARAR